MLKRPARVAGAIALVIALTACGSNSPSTTSSAPNSVANANSDATVNVGFTLEPTGLDIFTTSGAALRQLELGNVYEGLVRRTHTGELEPLLAEKWTIADDGLRYDFDLRKNVTYSDGQKMTAADVVAALAVGCGEACGAPKDAASPRMTAVKSIKAEGDNSVVIELKQRDWRLLDTLSTDIGLIKPSKHSVDLAKETNATGPYAVTNWQQGSSITLTRRDDYWGTKPKNKTVVFRYFKDAAAAANALSSGEIDMHAAPSPETVSRFSKDANFTVTEGSSASWMTLGFNNADPNLKDKRVRSALRKAIDKDGLIKTLGISAERVGSMSVPDDKWYVDNTKIDAYDPEKARAELKAAGKENLKLTLEVANTYDTRISEYIAAQLREVGVTVEIKQMEFANWLDKVYTKKDYQMTMVLHVDPWTLTYYANPEYYWNYNNAEVQKVYADAMTAETPEKGYEGLKKLSTMVSEDAASDWLYAPKTTTVASKKVAGYPTGRTGSQYFVFDIQKQG